MNNVKKITLLILLTITLFSTTANAMYSTQTGRFLQKDSLGVDPAGKLTKNPFKVHRQYADGANLYQYTKSSPVISLDPLGRCTYYPTWTNPPMWEKIDCESSTCPNSKNYIKPPTTPIQFPGNLDKTCGAFVYCRATRLGFPIYSLGQHCEVAINTPDNYGQPAKREIVYPVEISRSGSRKLMGGIGDGTDCSCATCPQIQSCIISQTATHGGNYLDNCQTSTARSLARCCLNSNWKAPKTYGRFGMEDELCARWEEVDFGFGGIMYRCTKWLWEY